MENKKTVIPNEKELEALTEIFSVFADSTRIRIICALRGGELSVNGICEAVEMSQPAVSHQLKTLKNAHVKCRREGRKSFYSLDDSHVEAILDMGTDHINHTKEH